MRAIVGIVGLLILLWSLGAGFMTRPGNRAEVFSGPVGKIVNLVVVLVGAAILVWAWRG